MAVAGHESSRADLRSRRNPLTRFETTALKRLQRWAPPFVHHVLERIEERGGRGLVVGGVVRDAFLNKVGADWDIATDLPPSEVAASFPRVVRTGEKHGTIMVIAPDGEPPVEVTTFRGEGPYLDGRRPAFVEFHADLVSDLARRDFTMNAVAADLRGNRIEDPFGGADDIELSTVRCVGAARERFREDGLRPLRAVRFASTLGFDIEPETQASLGGAIAVFERVAWERKRVELEKLLLGRNVVEAVTLLAGSGLLMAMAPELSADVELAALPRLPSDPWLRFAEWALRSELSVVQALELTRRFKVSNRVRRRVEVWMTAFYELDGPLDGPAFRGWLAAHGLEGARGAAEILTARFAADDNVRRWFRRTKQKLRSPPAYRVADLAISGADLLRLGFEGPYVGDVLRQLLKHVLERPSANRRSVLLSLAHRLSTPRTSN